MPDPEPEPEPDPEPEPEPEPVPVPAVLPFVARAEVYLTMSPPIPPVSPDIRQLPKEPGFCAHKGLSRPLSGAAVPRKSLGIPASA
ncbi:hypothetical protein Scani_02510 [Streptomyces caniferus]|uniref:Uncharacterized protein n=1 Tax=Streptomyces caniferus TaxID=285557 RepID=A0A640RXN8_9ACTN|nr:hypothetical protein Scani_02510 [Streptomyces caniferus]